MNRWLMYILFCAIILEGCSIQRVSFTKDAPKEFPPTKNIFTDYWSAMAGGMPQFADSFAVEDEKLTFALGIKAIKDGEIEKAESYYESLLSSKNDTLSSNSKLILRDLYAYQSRWEDCLKLLRENNESDSAAETRLFFPAYRRAPKEVISFERDVDTIPVNIVGRAIFVPVAINGKKYEFLFDTGCDISVVTESVAKECGIKPLRSHEAAAIASTGKLINTATTVIEYFHIGSFTSNNHPSIIVSDDGMIFKILFFTLMKLDGVIGWNAIKRLDVEIDMKNEIMIIRKPAKKDNIARNMFWLSYPIIVAKGEDGLEFNFGFDAGAHDSHVSDVFLQKIQLQELEDDTETYYGVGGKVTKAVKVIPEICMYVDGYGLNFKNINTGMPVGENFLSLDGVFGIDICRKGKFRIDPLNGFFDIEKYKIKVNRE